MSVRINIQSPVRIDGIIDITQHKHALIGTNGTGKTTLLTELSKIYNVPILGQEAVLPKSYTNATDTCIQYLLSLVVEPDDQHYAHELLSRLGLNENTPLMHLSGGWLRRLVLAGLLLLRPSPLLLDEPTNHLDNEAIQNLCECLAKYKYPLVIVSHSPWFLERCCNRTIHLHDNIITTSPHNYSKYWKVYVKELEVLTAKYEEAKRRKVAANKKGKQSAPLPIKPIQHKPIRFAAPVFQESRNNILGTILLNGEVQEIDRNTRLILTGKNGCGKTTALKTLTTNDDVKVGSIVQTHCYDNIHTTLTQYIMQKYNLIEEVACKNLGLVQLAGLRHVLPSQLSGGQRQRLAIAELCLQQPELLVLDEPTNNLDLETNVAFLDMLTQYEGAYIIATHMPELIELGEEIPITNEE